MVDVVTIRDFFYSKHLAANCVMQLHTLQSIHLKQCRNVFSQWVTVWGFCLSSVIWVFIAIINPRCFEFCVTYIWAKITMIPRESCFSAWFHMKLFFAVCALRIFRVAPVVVLPLACFRTKFRSLFFARPSFVFVSTIVALNRYWHCRFLVLLKHDCIINQRTLPTQPLLSSHFLVTLQLP